MASPTASPGRYPRQLVIMVETETGEHVDKTALNNRVSMSEVARTYIGAGIAVGKIAAEHGLDLDRLLQLANLAALHETRADAPTVVEHPAAAERPATMTIEIPLEVPHE